LAALVEDMAASTGVKPASLIWWLYATIDMMRTHETRQLVLLAGWAATIMGTVALTDAPPDGSETTH
jgi:hypothetical protein